MTPTLARRGILILASAATFVLVGALNGTPALVAMGGVVIISFLAVYLWFFPAAILLRRRKVEISWWLPAGDLPGGALSVDHPLPLHIALRNHGGRRLRVLRVEVLGNSAIDPPTGLEAVMSPGKQVELVGTMYARQPGYHVLHGTILYFGDILGLFGLRAYFPNSLPFKVFPSANALRIGIQHGVGDGEQSQGLHQLRRRGLAGDLREIREHAHGDPFKNIAWKATARRRKLMVRDLENEVVLTHQYVLDIGGSMRSGKPGERKLDRSIALITNMAKIALDAGDRVGLITFDSRVYSQLASGAGRKHYLEIVDQLVGVNSVVDEDLTDLTNSELVAAIARYLAHQEAVDLRLARAPAIDSPQWEHIQAGPKGELYDLIAMRRVVHSLLKLGDTQKDNKKPRWWNQVHMGPDSAPLMSKLRLFARLRGIELPYRHHHEFGKRAQGLSSALTELTKTKADHSLVFTDLEGFLEAPKARVTDLARARKRGRQLAIVVPAHTPSSQTPATKSLREILELEEDMRLERARRILLPGGIPMLNFGPNDNTATVMAQVTRARGGIRGRVSNPG